MTRRRETGSYLARWSLATILAIALHGAFVYAVLTRTDEESSGPPGGALFVELAAIDAAPERPPSVAAGPEQQQSEASKAAAKPSEEEPVEERPIEETKPAEPQPALVKAPDPDPLPIEEPKKEEKEEVPPPPQAQSVAQAASAPQVLASQPAPIATTTVKAAPSADRSAVRETWMTKVQEALERSKKAYPSAAQRRGDTGTAYVSFSLDVEGKVLAMRLQRSSGSPALDDEALAILERAAPFPPPPSGLSGPNVQLSVPVKFSLSR